MTVRKLETPKSANSYGCVAGKNCNCPTSFPTCSLYWEEVQPEREDVYTKLDSYGVAYEGEQGSYVPAEEEMTLAELSARGGRIVRVRWIGGDYIPGRGKCYDLSYVHGELKDGTRVRLSHLPAAFLVAKHLRKGAMIDWAKQEGVFAKGLGLLEDSNWSTLG